LLFKGSRTSARLAKTKTNGGGTDTDAEWVFKI